MMKDKSISIWPLIALSFTEEYAQQSLFKVEKPEQSENEKQEKLRKLN